MLLRKSLIHLRFAFKLSLAGPEQPTAVLG